MVKTIYFGTHDFSAYILEHVILSNQYEIAAVITQPDRPVGRNQEMVKSAVKIVAEKYQLPILQPESLKRPPFEILNLKSEIFVVCQYGLIIPKQILDLPTFGSINVHTSLLPRYRGASPIQTALLNGEIETGVTIMLMDEKMDHGPILSQDKIVIDPDDTYLALSKKMEPMAAQLLLKTIPAFLGGIVTPQIQDESQATFCKMFGRDDGRIDWHKSGQEVYNLFRGLTPWPGVWTVWDGKRLKLTHILPSPLRRGTEGEVFTSGDKHLHVGCNEDSIEILELQIEGKKPMDARTFLNGYKNFIHAKLE